MTPQANIIILAAIFGIAWAIYRHVTRPRSTSPTSAWGYRPNCIGKPDSPVDTLSPCWMFKRLREAGYTPKTTTVSIHYVASMPKRKPKEVFP